MRKRTRFLAYVLAAAMVVTSAPADLTMTASAATGTISPEKSSEKQAEQSFLTWNRSALEGAGKLSSDPDEGFVYKDALTLTQTQTFKGKALERGDLYTPIAGSSEMLAPLVSLDQGGIRNAFGVTSNTNVTVGASDFDYQWFYVSADGTKTKITTDSAAWSLDREKTTPDGDKEEENTITNLEEKGSWYCEITLNSVTIDGNDYSFSNLSADKRMNQKLTVVFDHQYIGPTAQDFKNKIYTAEDFFTGMEDAGDTEAAYRSYAQHMEKEGAPVGSLVFRVRNKWPLDTDFEDKFTQDQIDRIDISNANISYEWKAVAKDGKTEKVMTSYEHGTNGVWSFSDKKSKYEFEDGVYKEVDYYQCTAKLYYGYIPITTLTKTYKVVYHPFDVIQSASPVRVRQNGKTTFKVTSVDIRDSETVEGYNYQWYSVAKNGKETKLDGQITNILKAKITDFDTYYICRVTAEWKEAYKNLGEISVDAAFHTTNADGYLVKEISPTYQEAKIGDQVELAIDAKTDAGYGLAYQWEKYYRDGDGEIQSKELGNKASYTVSLKGEEDFATVDRDPELGSYYPYSPFTYKLTVTVTRNKETYATHYYYFRIGQEEEVEEVSPLIQESNGGRIVSLRGKDVELFVKTRDLSGQKPEKKWYKRVASNIEVDQMTTYSADGDVIDEERIYSEDTFQEPENVYLEWNSIWDTNIYTDGNGARHVTISGWVDVYQEITKNQGKDNYLLSGKVSGKFNDDILGHYLMKIRLDNHGETEEDSVEWDVEYENSQLNVYVKNSRVQAAEGSTAKLEVIAGNIDTDAYPITYQWTKYNNKTGKYEPIQGETNSLLTIKNVSKEDYGTYRVIVTDVYHDDEGLKIERAIYSESIELESRAAKYVEYTPTNATFTKALGESITLKAEMELEEGVTPFYAWYREEKVAGGYTDYGDSNKDQTAEARTRWEIIDQDTNEYAFTINSEDDYTRYRCEVSFLIKQDGETLSVKKTFNYYVTHYSFELERLSLQNQNKKEGDSVTHSVRVITDDPYIEEGDITYQWYRYDESGKLVEIQGATGSTYTIDSLKSEDFGRIEVKAVAKDGRETELVSFLTIPYFYTSAYLESNYDKLEVKPGESVDLAPVIRDGADVAWTYQWYRYEDVWEEEQVYGGRQIMHGETSSTLKLTDLGENEITRYVCVISREYNGETIEWNTYTVTLTKRTETSHIYATVADGCEKDQKVTLGRSASFAVKAVSSEDLPLKYQWYYTTSLYGEDFGGFTAIGEATDAAYHIDAVTLNHFGTGYGTYKCTVMDPNGRQADVYFTLNQTDNMEIRYDTLNQSDFIGYETTIGGSVTLTATATCAQEYEIYYQWYRRNENTNEFNLMYGETAATLTLTNVTLEKLGDYCCRIYTTSSQKNENDKRQYLFYTVYVDNGLLVVPGSQTLLTQADGTVKMFVSASANEPISFEWSKYTKTGDGDTTEWNDHGATYPPLDVEGSSTDTGYYPPYYYPEVEGGSNGDGSSQGVWDYVPLDGGVGDTYILPQLTKNDYGIYRCVVSTSGQKYTYYFRLYFDYVLIIDRVFAEQGDTVNISASLINPAVDLQYDYTWYAQESATGSFRKVQGDGDVLSTTVSKVLRSDDVYSDSSNRKNTGYVTTGYKCVVGVTDPSGTEEPVEYPSVAATINVLPTVNYSTSLPETNHPNNQEWNVQGYRADGAKQLNITFDEQTSPGAANLYVIDGAGMAKRWFATYTDMILSGYSEGNAFYGNKITVNGDKAIFLINENDTPESYGYKVASIEAVKEPTAPTEVTTSGAVTKGAVKLPAKGKKVTKNKIIYKVTKSHKTKGTVAVVGIKKAAKKKMTKVNIPATIKIKGYKFKVTAVNKNAVKGLPKLKSVTIGKNVTSIGAGAFAGNKKLTTVTIGAKVKKIGANAFSGDKKLKKLTIKSTKLKSVGKKAFAKVPKKAVAKVPKKQKKAYKKLLKKKGGFKGKVK